MTLKLPLQKMRSKVILCGFNHFKDVSEHMGSDTKSFQDTAS